MRLMVSLCSEGSCLFDERSVIDKYTSASCSIFSPHKQYCYHSPTQLIDCTWRGNGTDCPDAKCEPDEVAIARDSQGSGYESCWCE